MSQNWLPRYLASPFSRLFALISLLVSLNYLTRKIPDTDGRTNRKHNGRVRSLYSRAEDHKKWMEVWIVVGIFVTNNYQSKALSRDRYSPDKNKKVIANANRSRVSIRIVDREIPCGAKNCTLFIFSITLSTTFYVDNFWHTYLNEFPTPCIYHILCRLKHR